MAWVALVILCLLIAGIFKQIELSDPTMLEDIKHPLDSRRGCLIWVIFILMAIVAALTITEAAIQRLS
jgi:Mn2+/Fe2+ NRAMP family transporter